jgi:hypothetical protein
MVKHEPYCTGGHLESISCADVAKLRAEVAANPWYCKGATRSGYHLFGPEENPEAQCQYEGCNTTWGELTLNDAGDNPYGGANLEPCGDDGCRCSMSLPPRVQRIRFRDKADMMHMLDEPQIVEGYRSMVSASTALPVVFDPDVPPREYRIDY